VRDLVSILLLDLLASMDFGEPNTHAAWVAAIYFGTFIFLGWTGKRALGRWMVRHGEHLDEVQKQAGESARKGDSFLLGIWRKL
jgi:hypothetical protein